MPINEEPKRLGPIKIPEGTKINSNTTLLLEKNLIPFLKKNPGIIFMHGLIKQKLYSGGKQYKNKENLWEAIKNEFKNISSGQIENLTKSVDNRLVKIIEKGGAYIGYKI